MQQARSLQPSLFITAKHTMQRAAAPCKRAYPAWRLSRAAGCAGASVSAGARRRLARSCARVLKWPGRRPLLLTAPYACCTLIAWTREAATESAEPPRVRRSGELQGTNDPRSLRKMKLLVRMKPPKCDARVNCIQWPAGQAAAQPGTPPWHGMLNWRLPPAPASYSGSISACRTSGNRLQGFEQP